MSLSNRPFEDITPPERRLIAGFAVNENVMLTASQVLVNKIRGKAAAEAIMADYTRNVALHGLWDVRGKAERLDLRVMPEIDRKPSEDIDILRLSGAVVIGPDGEELELGPSRLIGVELMHVVGSLSVRRGQTA